MLLYLLRLPSGGVVVTGELGRLLFIGILFIELMLIIFIRPFSRHSLATQPSVTWFGLIDLATGFFPLA